MLTMCRHFLVRDKESLYFSLKTETNKIVQTVDFTLIFLLLKTTFIDHLHCTMLLINMEYERGKMSLFCPKGV